MILKDNLDPKVFRVEAAAAVLLQESEGIATNGPLQDECVLNLVVVTL